MCIRVRYEVRFSEEKKYKEDGFYFKEAATTEIYTG